MTHRSGGLGIERNIVRVQQTFGASVVKYSRKIIDVDEKKKWRENTSLRNPRRGEVRRGVTPVDDGERAISQKGTDPLPGAAVHTGFFVELQQ